MSTKIFNFSTTLQPNQVLRLRDNILYVENKSYRQNRFFLLRLWTNSEYDENRILINLLWKAKSVDALARKQFYINTMELLLKKAETENIGRIYRAPIIRWLLGTPIINVRYFKTQLENLREMIKPEERIPLENPKPVPNNAVNPPVKVMPTAPYVKLENKKLLEVMNESLKNCNSHYKHSDMLRRWITLVEKQELILQKTKEFYQKQWTSEGKKETPPEDYYTKNLLNGTFKSELQRFILNETNLSLYPDQNNTTLSIQNAPQEYARIYLSLKNDKKDLNEFYQKVFDGSWPCFAGNYRQMLEYFEKKGLTNQDLIPDLIGKKTLATIGELDRVFQATKMREFIQLYHDHKYNEKDAEDARIREEYLKNQGIFVADFKQAEETKENLIAFIKQSQHLPIETADGITLTPENIDEQVDAYYEAVY